MKFFFLFSQRLAMDIFDIYTTRYIPIRMKSNYSNQGFAVEPLARHLFFYYS